MKDFIRIAGPWITDKEIQYVAEATAQGWYSQSNFYQERFEQAFARYVGKPFAAALPSCTSAIHLALAAWGIGPGDEVIVPDIAWIACAAPIAYVGATPVFADVDAKTWCLSPESLEACMTPRTKAIMAVDLYGHIFAANEIRAIARRRGLHLLEDAAEAVGSEYQGCKAGSLGDAGVFSFHGTKTMTTGEGGMFVTGDEELYRRVLVLRNHGQEPGAPMFWNVEVAYKYKMSALQAALGTAQLERIEELVERKRQIFNWYVEELKALDGITLNTETAGTKNSYWMVTVIWDAARFGLAKEELMRRLAERGIDSRPFFYPLSSLPAYAGHPEAQKAARRNTVSYRLAPCGINLPSALNLTREQVKTVCNVFKEIFDRDASGIHA